MEPITVLKDREILAEATYGAALQLGVSKAQVARIVGRNRTTIDRNGLDPATKPGELALMFVRIYRSLFALMGGDTENMRHFMITPNHGTGGVPLEQVQKVGGLVRVCEYLDAIRGKG
ncbi:MAG: MbcA/ParS/Xre antitoxin family protein [Pseudomonadota bacterium]